MEKENGRKGMFSVIWVSIMVLFVFGVIFAGKVILIESVEKGEKAASLIETEGLADLYYYGYSVTTDDRKEIVH